MFVYALFNISNTFQSFHYLLQISFLLPVKCKKCKHLSFHVDTARHLELFHCCAVVYQLILHAVFHLYAYR